MCLEWSKKSFPKIGSRVKTYRLYGLQWPQLYLKPEKYQCWSMLVNEYTMIRENKLVRLVRLRNIEASLEKRCLKLLARNKMTGSGEISKAKENGHLTMWGTTQLPGDFYIIRSNWASRSISCPWRVIHSL